MKELKLSALPELPFETTEALNQLRVNLGFCGSGIKTLLITSSTPNEGKSYVSMNLWRAMAAAGLRVLLIDADLRKSEMRVRYGMSGEGELVGITHYLAGQAELRDVIYRTAIAGGCILPMNAPAANPPILLGNGRFSQLLAACRDRFDYILVDTPPLTAVADAMQLAPFCDGSVLVVHSGVTPRKTVDYSVQMLKKADVPLLGILLNRVQSRRKGGRYYYDHYYGYGGYGPAER